MPRLKKPKTRDSELTRRALIAAVGNLLAREGFQALGVNAVAKEANCLPKRARTKISPKSHCKNQHPWITL